MLVPISAILPSLVASFVVVSPTTNYPSPSSHVPVSPSPQKTQPVNSRQLKSTPDPRRSQPTQPTQPIQSGTGSTPSGGFQQGSWEDGMMNRLHQQRAK